MLFFSARVINQLIQGYICKPVVNSLTKSVDLTFRCWPVDIDLFFHMNNSRYLQNAELARWRTLPASNLLDRVATKEGMLFLAVENNVKYLRPIAPFEKYVITTTCTVRKSDDKWIHYQHVFQQHPDNVPKGLDPHKFCVIDLKAVIKQKNGKTLKPSTLVKESPLYQEWFTMVDDVDEEQQEAEQKMPRNK
jgi:acyl-CoA thioesterase FadM